MYGIKLIFSSALANGTFLWQGVQFITNYSDFFQFCDYVENVLPQGNSSNGQNTTVVPDENGVGLQKALSGYATWTREFRLPGCRSSSFIIIADSEL